MEAAESTEYTEWQWPLSGVCTFHYDGKISPVWLGWGMHLIPLCTLPTTMSKVLVYAPAETADTLPLFLLYPYMYSVAESIPYRLKLFGSEQQYSQLNLEEYSFYMQPPSPLKNFLASKILWRSHSVSLVSNTQNDLNS
jgi:hypothetical protein